MFDILRYPQFNDRPHDRPILSVYGGTPLGELIWIAIPILVIAIAVLSR